MEPLIIKGIENLNDYEKAEANRILNDSLGKIARKIKNEFALKVVVKEYSRNPLDKTDVRKKYSINAEVLSATNKFVASTVDWDLNRALHKAVAKLLAEIEKRFHTSEQGKATCVRKHTKKKE